MREEQDLAEHPGARPGGLPAGDETSPSSVAPLCGDAELRLHLRGQRRPVATLLSPGQPSHHSAVACVPIKDRRFVALSLFINC